MHKGNNFICMATLCNIINAEKPVVMGPGGLNRAESGGVKSDKRTPGLF